MTAVDLPAIRALLAGIEGETWALFDEDQTVRIEGDGAIVHDCSMDDLIEWQESRPRAAFIAAAPSIVAQLVAVVERVRHQHPPVDVFGCGDDGTPVSDDEGGKLVRTLCRTCSDSGVIENVEDANYDTSGEYGEVTWPCPTIKAITGECQ